MKTTLLVLFALAFFHPYHNTNSDAIIGIWQSGNGKGHIQIFKQNGKYHGKIIWLKEPLDKVTGHPKLDNKNPDPSKRNVPIMGMVVMRDFNYEDGEWTNGHIYDPSGGKEYKAYLKLKDINTLLVRGYIGISLIGKTDTWTRIR
ncbi:MAG: DUF2147 domain-containing protein [Chitinophagaceae bacterium]